MPPEEVIKGRTANMVAHPSNSCSRTSKHLSSAIRREICGDSDTGGRVQTERERERERKSRAE